MTEEKITVFNDGYSAGQKSVVDFEVKIELRDKFAMAALTGVIAEGTWLDLRGKEGVITVCESAYEFADAMLAERDK